MVRDSVDDVDNSSSMVTWEAPEEVEDLRPGTVRTIHVHVLGVCHFIVRTIHVHVLGVCHFIIDLHVKIFLRVQVESLS